MWRSIKIGSCESSIELQFTRLVWFIRSCVRSCVRRGGGEARHDYACWLLHMKAYTRLMIPYISVQIAFCSFSVISIVLL